MQALVVSHRNREEAVAVGRLVGRPARRLASGVALSARSCLAPCLLAALLLAACSATPGGTDPFESAGAQQRGVAYLAFPRELDFEALPKLLSETGAFLRGPEGELQPAPSLTPYGVRSPLWSDGLLKRRWVMVPRGQTVEFSPTEAWGFPPGSIFIKDFSLSAVEGGAPGRLLETRFLVAQPGGNYYGVTYRWDRFGEDARLVTDAETERLRVETASSPRTESHFYPGPKDCPVCHTKKAGTVLGLRTAQLNGPFDYEHSETPLNQLTVWAEIGLLDDRSVLTRPTADYPRFAALDETDASPERRLRSYWASNCAMCHRGDRSPALWDARFSVPLNEQGIVRGRLHAAPGVVVVPGDPEASDMYARAVTSEPGRVMPPLGNDVVDERYAGLLRQWIATLE